MAGKRTELVMALVLSDDQFDDLMDALSYAVFHAERADWAARVRELARHMADARLHAERELMPDADAGEG